MTILLARIVPREQLLVVHAPLGEVEWPDTVEHIQNTLPPDVPLILAPVASGKSLLDRIEERGRFPSAGVRFCTSDHKRGPIERELRRYLKSHPRFGGRLVNAMGLRADESAARARKTPWKRSDRNSRAGRTWFDWLPIFDLSTDDVFRIIRDAGQSPHWAYAAGMSRLSCSFCILASRADLRRATELRPGLYRKYVDLERRIGHTLSPTCIPLPQLTGVPVEPAAAALRPCDDVRVDRSLDDPGRVLPAPPCPHHLRHQGDGNVTRRIPESAVPDESEFPSLAVQHIRWSGNRTVVSEVAVEERHIAFTPVARIASLRPGEAEGDQGCELDGASVQRPVGFASFAHRVVDVRAKCPRRREQRGFGPRFGREAKPQGGRGLPERLGRHVVQIAAESVERLGGRALNHVEHRGPQVRVALAAHFVQHRRRHVRVLELSEGLARLHAPELAAVADEH